MVAPGTVTGDELWFAIPAGWIELVAHENDEEAAQWFDRLLGKTPDTFDEAAKKILRSSYDEVRRQMPRGLVDAAGALITSLDDEVTLWQFSVTLLSMPPAGDVNVMAVIEKFMNSAQGREGVIGDGDFIENFQTPDGRDGIAIHTTTQIDDNGRLAANVPGVDADRLGVVYAAVRLNRPSTASSDRLAVVTGVAPNVEQRLAMAIVAAQITISARLHDSDAEPLPGRIDVDVAGRQRDRSPMEADHP